MNELNNFEKFTTDELAQHYTGETAFKAKNSAYSFDLFSDLWEVDHNCFLKLDWMREAEYSPLGFVMVRWILAFRASSVSYCTLRKEMYALIKAYKESIESSLEFQVFYHDRKDSTQVNDCKIFRALDKDKSSKNNDLRQFFSEIITFVKTQKYEANHLSNILDPTKGAYSEVEYASAKEKLRLVTEEVFNEVNAKKTINFKHVAGMGVVIAMQLMIAIMRRPTQLVQLKWSDVLPVGTSFGNHRDTKACGVPKHEHMFSDVDQLHIRIFRGKNGEFRKNVEIRSQRLDPDFSTLLLFYRVCYERVLKERLRSIGIELSPLDLKELMFRCPVFAHQEIFNYDFKNKENVFRSLTLFSKGFHKNNDNLNGNLAHLNKNLNIESDRIAKISLANNRVRHTVLTEGAITGFSEVQLAMITGVTQGAVRPYIDLTMEARLDIDNAFAEKKIFQQFATVGVAEIQKKQGFKKIIDEFDEELGVIKQPLNCNSCQAKLGAPIGCYGCGNFRPHPEANHRANLEKAERKLALNQDSGKKATLKKLLSSIVYIRATITVCNDLMLREKGLQHDQ
jgi:predicted transcriptional regulator